MREGGLEGQYGPHLRISDAVPSCSMSNVVTGACGAWSTWYRCSGGSRRHNFRHNFAAAAAAAAFFPPLPFFRLIFGMENDAHGSP